MTYEELWSGGIKLLSTDRVFALGTDAVLLSAFADKGGVKTVCDLGTGSGVIALLLAWENPRLTVDGIEIQKESAHVARLNAEANGLSDRVRIIEADLREHRTLGGAGKYDLVISNPPYFPVGSGKSAKSENTAIARDERMCTLADICRAAAYFTRWGGKFAIVHRPERLSELFCEMTKNAIEPKRLRLVQETEGSPPNLVLVEGRRGGNPGLSIEQPLVIRDADGCQTDFINRIYRLQTGKERQ